MCKKVHLDSYFAEIWRNKDVFEEAGKLGGELFRHVKARKTFRFESGGRGYFAKIHNGIGWKEIFKDILQLKTPVLGADNEFAAIQRLTELGGKTMTVCAFGSCGSNPAARKSFLITAELKDMPSLEEYTQLWSAENMPLPGEKIKLAAALARAVALMHDNGINHRDCYLCHFLLKKPEYDLYVIDLHRAQIRKSVPLRYRIKDVAGIWFSAMDVYSLSRNDRFRFMKEYFQCGLRETLTEHKSFWRRVDAAAHRTYRREARKIAQGIPR